MSIGCKESGQMVKRKSVQPFLYKRAWIHTLECHHLCMLIKQLQQRIYRSAFSFLGKPVAAFLQPQCATVVTDKGEVVVLNAASGEKLWGMKVESLVDEVCICGNTCAMMVRNSKRNVPDRILVVDVGTDTVQHDVHGNWSSLWSMECAPDGSSLAVVCVHEDIRGNHEYSSLNFMSLTSGEMYHWMNFRQKWIASLAYSPSGINLAVITGDSERWLHIIEAASGYVLRIVELVVPHECFCKVFLQYTPGGDSILVGFFTNTKGAHFVQEVDAISGSICRELSLEEHSWTHWHGFSPDGTCAAIRMFSSSPCIFNVHVGQRYHYDCTSISLGSVKAAAWLPQDATLIAACYKQDKSYLIDVANGSTLCELQLEGIKHLQFLANHMIEPQVNHQMSKLRSETFVIEQVHHDEPSAIQDENVAMLQADLDWSDYVEKRIQLQTCAASGITTHPISSSPTSEFCCDIDNADVTSISEKVHLLRFGSAPAGGSNAMQFFDCLRNGPELSACRQEMESGSCQWRLLQGALVFVHVSQYDAVRASLVGIELHPYHVIVSESFEYLIEEVLNQIPYKRRPRVKSGNGRTEIIMCDVPQSECNDLLDAEAIGENRIEEDSDPPATLCEKRTFLCAVRLPGAATSVVQSSTEVVVTESRTHYAKARGTNPRRVGGP